MPEPVTFQFTIFHLAAFGVVFIGALWALVVIIAKLQEKSLENQFNGMKDAIKGVKDSIAKEQETTQRLEREVLQFKVEVSRDYVRRDDFIRAVGTIEAKFDNLALRMERALLNGRAGSDT